MALITFPDALQSEGEPTLKTLTRFLDSHVGDTVNTVHILPFNPYSSDRGFSVIDYSVVDPRFGDWEDINTIGERYEGMADIVLGHISAQSHEFQEFLAGNPDYNDYFIWWRPEEVDAQLEGELRKVRRPRATPLLTEFETADGPKKVWTTFSVNGTTDQIDVNYANPDVLLDKIEVMLRNLQHGVSTFRMDALTYVWKELGTECASLPQNHAILEIFKNVLKEVSPNARIITETNVPHAENISYFGDGENGADMVYNFALPPLVLHAFYRGDATFLAEWAKTLKTPSEKTAFFNFLGSHDGIGLLGAKGILPAEEIAKLPEQVLAHGGKVSTRALPDGGEAVYEMNTTWWSALNNGSEDADLEQRRFLTSHAISFALQGVPAIYYHSLLGSENATDVVANRDINEKKLDYAELETKLLDTDSKEHTILQALKGMMEYRRTHPAFSPNAPQEILDVDERVFGLKRKSDHGDILALHNVSGDTVPVTYGNDVYILKPYGFTWVPVDAVAA